MVEPLFELRFPNCSYAYRYGQGLKKAIGKVTFYIRHDKRNWAIFGNLDNFFDSLNHDRLVDEVKKVIYEAEVLALIRMWMKIGAIDQRCRSTRIGASPRAT